MLHLRQNGSAGGGKAGYGFKQGINVEGDCFGNIKGDCPYQAENKPTYRHAYHAVSGIKGAFGIPAEEIHGAAHQGNQSKRDGKAIGSGAFSQEKADEQGGNQKDSLYQKHLGGEPPHHLIVHEAS